MTREEIKKLRNKLGLTQDNFAFKLGVTPYTVRRWESGKASPNPLSVYALRRLERAAR